MKNARRRLGNFWNHRYKIDWLHFQIEQRYGRIRLAFNRGSARDGMEKRRAEAVDVAAKILRRVVQSLRCDIIGRPPNLTSIFRALRRHAREAEVADLRRVFVDEEDVRGFDVAMNEPFCIRRPQAFRDLNAGLKHLFFRQMFSLLYKIIQAAVIDQLHHQIKLPVIGTRRKNLYHIGVINRCRYTRFLLQLFGLIDPAFQILAQQFQRDQALE